MFDHRAAAAEAFNAAWELIDRPERSADDDVQMLLLAAVSRWHWERAGGGAEEMATGDWQVAHVASLLGNGELALLFARRAMAAAETNGWTGWRLASMHEGMARACATAGDDEGRGVHIAAAEAALAAEPDAESRAAIAAQLDTVPAVGG